MEHQEVRNEVQNKVTTRVGTNEIKFKEQRETTTSLLDELTRMNDLEYKGKSSQAFLAEPSA